jgi:SAM-dependent methyltransferase
VGAGAPVPERLGRQMTTPTRWTAISRDPNDAAVLRWRNQLLASTRRAPVTRRLDHLRELARGRQVLDVGVVEHFVENQRNDTWLHGQLVEVAASCRGIDILADDVATLREKGYDVEVHDLTAGPTADRYELVVMGDIIEHLGAPEPFLANVRECLRPNGRLVVTTPNPYMLHRAVKSLRGGFPDSVDHAVLLGPGNMVELAQRCGLRLDAWRGVRLKDLPGWRNRATAFLRRALVAVGFAEEIACDTMIYEFVPVER